MSRFFGCLNYKKSIQFFTNKMVEIYYKKTTVETLDNYIHNHNNNYNDNYVLIAIFCEIVCDGDLNHSKMNLNRYEALYIILLLFILKIK
jgi:hypothetical protein